MASELWFALVIAVIVVAGIAIIQIGKYRRRIAYVISKRLGAARDAVLRRTGQEERPADGSDTTGLNEQEMSKAELRRLQSVIEERKQVARDTDVSYHLWGLYRSYFRHSGSLSLDRYVPDGEWYDVKILDARTVDGQNRFEFELKGSRFTFVDDEEKQGWSDNIKYFSLYLYDGTDRCLIEVPMKVRVDRLGRNYSISSDGPYAFLPGDWVNDFISVKLKQQSVRNQEIRAQKHQERLCEIEELKERFGISD